MSAAAQLPPWQSFEQHTDGPLHDAPFCEQLAKPETEAHFPPSQRFAQQSAFVAHAPPPESQTRFPPSPPVTSGTVSDPHAKTNANRERTATVNLFRIARLNQYAPKQKGYDGNFIDRSSY